VVLSNSVLPVQSFAYLPQSDPYWAIFSMPAPSKPQLDATWLSNHYIEDSKRSYHSCARCIVFFATEASKYLGKWGCIMANLSDNDYKKVSAWRVGEGNDAEQYMRCMRCWNLGQECCSVSAPICVILTQSNSCCRSLTISMKR